MTSPAPHIPVEERFIPTVEQLRELWTKKNPVTGGNYAGAAERIEYELGFEVAIARLQGRLIDYDPTSPKE